MSQEQDKVPNSLIATINEAVLNAVNRTLQMLTLRKVRVQLDDYGIMPERAHSTDAGADIRTPVAFVLPAKSSHRRAHWRAYRAATADQVRHSQQELAEHQ